MSQTKIEPIHNLPFDTYWHDMIRGFAAAAIVVHHWLLFVPHQSNISLYFSLAQYMCSVAGTAVHLFFVLSGCGLVLSYYKKSPFSWLQWMNRRTEKIILPYWIVVSSTFVLVNIFAFLCPRININSYSWATLITYLTFTRNFYQPSRSLNPAFWFMPVIFGLYLTFPLLIHILKKSASFIFLLFPFSLLMAPLRFVSYLDIT